MLKRPIETMTTGRIVGGSHRQGWMVVSAFHDFAQSDLEVSLTPTVRVVKPKNNQPPKDVTSLTTEEILDGICDETEPQSPAKAAKVTLVLKQNSDYNPKDKPQEEYTGHPRTDKGYKGQ